MTSMSWTSPTDIKAKLQRLWDNGRLLTVKNTADPLYPISIALNHPGPQDVSHRFEEARIWVRELEEGAKPVKGYGYEIVWTEINNRHIGKNSLPTS
ncbi:MAG: DUF3322 domain-containing protein, partial [Fibrobacteria bacterium]